MIKPAWFFIFLLFVAYAIRYATLSEFDPVLESVAIRHDVQDRPVVIIAKVIDEPNQKNGYVSVKTKPIMDCSDADNVSETEMRCHHLESTSFLIVSMHAKQLEAALASSDMSALQVSDELMLTGMLQSVEKSMQDAKQGYLNYLRKERVYYDFKIKKVERVHAPETLVIQRFLIGIRKSIESSIADAIPKPQSDLAQGLVISGKGSLSEDLIAAFTAVGLIHIVVLSGSNVSIISSALFSALAFMPAALRSFFGIFAMAAFAIMTGASPPVVRSVIMTSLPMVLALFRGNKDGLDGVNHAEKHDRGDELIGAETSAYRWYAPLSIFRERIMSVELLLITALVMSVWDPLLPVFDVSFQLSFMATLGLMTLTGPISNRLRWITDRFSIREVIASSVATQILVSPLLLNISGQLSTVFLIANLVVLPILPLVMFCVFCVSVLSFISPFLTIAMAEISSAALAFIMDFVQLLASFKWASIELGKISATAAWVANTVILASILGMKFSSRNNEMKIPRI